MADAVLATKILLCGTSCVPPGRKFSKGSRGAEKWVSWEHHEEITNALGTLKHDGVKIVALELCDTSVDYTNLRYEEPVCFVVGSERDGVSEEALALSDAAIHLPMLGMSNSLNVSTATSVILYDWLRKNRI